MTFDEAIAYLAGALDDRAAEALDEAILRGAHDGGDLFAAAAIVRGLRDAAPRGTLTMAITAAEREHLAQEGYVLRRVTLVPDVMVEVDLGGDWDLIALEYALDLRGVARLDLELCDGSGRALKRMPEVGYDTQAGRLIGLCDRELALETAKYLPSTIVRFISVEDGVDRVIGTFPSRPA